MSKDIRSYFTTKSVTPSVKKITNEQVGIKKTGQRKRPVVLIDSDSDDEQAPTCKQSKTSEFKVADKNSSSGKPNTNVTSKSFEHKQVNVSDVFGGRRVKRDNSRNIVKKVVTKQTLKFHYDDDFESELLKLDVLDQLDCGIPNGKIESNCTNETSKDNEEKINGILECKKETTNNNSDINVPDVIPRKRIKLEEKKESPNPKKTNLDLEEKIECSPSKMQSPLKESITKVDNNVVNKINTSQYFSKKISPSFPSPTSLFPDLAPNTSPTDKECLSKSLNNPNKQEQIEINNKLKKQEISCQNSSSKGEPVNKIDNEIKNVYSSCNLWVEKYKPSTTKQIIGQQGGQSCVNKLIFWLKNWHKNHSGHKKIMKPNPMDGAYFKAALLSGPPGVGKTTTAHLVSKELGFDVVEFNASDTRSKKLLHQEVSELLSTNSLSTFFSGKSEQVTKNHVLLMDEVDGMAGNEDRGGVQELIQLIKAARVPIICMCNDRNHPKIRSLSNYCFDLRFSKPRAEQIKGAMMSVCFKEKLKISPMDMTEIITSANQDIRLIINHLSMLSIEKSNLTNSSKHIKVGPWDITRQIFSEEQHKSMSIQDKCDLFFHDYNATPLFVQENYLNAVPHKPEGKHKAKKMELFAKAARSLSLGDLTEKSIRSHNAWGLLPVQAVFSSLVPGDVLEGHIGAQINFPAWFGKNSRQTKMSRLLQELTVHTRLKISGNKEAMNLDYLIPLGRAILMPLVSNGTEGIPTALDTLNEYCLVREDLESFTELSSWPNSKNLFAEVESKVKAAFTRAYNKTSAPTPYAAVPIKKASKSDIDSMDIGEEEENGSQDLEEEEEEEEEGLSVDSMIMVKKPSKKVNKDIPSTSKKSTNSKRGRKK